MTIDQARALNRRRSGAAVFSDRRAFATPTLAPTSAGTIQQAPRRGRPSSRRAGALVHDQAGIGVALKQVDVLRAQLARAQARWRSGP